MILPPSSHRTFSTSPVISDCTIFEKEVSTRLAMCPSTYNLLWWPSFNLTWTCLLIQMMGSNEPVGSFLNNHCSSLILDPSWEQLLLKGADLNPTWKYLVRWKKEGGLLFIRKRMGRFLYLNRLLGTKLLQVAYNLSLIDYLTLSNPSMNIKEFLPQTGRIQVIHISYQAFHHWLYRYAIHTTDIILHTFQLHNSKVSRNRSYTGCL